MAEAKKEKEFEFRKPLTTDEKIMILGAAIGLLIIAVPFATGNKDLFGLFAFGALLGGSAPYLVYLYLKEAKSNAIEEQFPNFLRDVASSKKAGMTLPLAVAKCAASDYGALTPEVKKMSEQISWGVSFDEALQRFGDRIGSSFIRKSITIILEAYRSGGAISDVLESVAEDSKMIRESDREQRATLSQYVTTVYVIQVMFVAILVSLTDIMGPLSQVPSLSFGMMPGAQTVGSSGIKVDEYKLLFFHMAVIQGFFNGLLAGQIGSGAVISGLKHSLIFITIALVVFYFMMFDQNAVCMFQPSAAALMSIPSCATGA